MNFIFFFLHLRIECSHSSFVVFFLDFFLFVKTREKIEKKIALLYMYSVRVYSSKQICFCQTFVLSVLFA